MAWLETGEEGVVIAVHACPRASRTAVQGLHGEALKIRLQSPPVDGRANEALIDFLSDTLDVPRRDIVILSGAADRRKRLAVRGVTPAQVRGRLLPEGSR